MNDISKYSDRGLKQGKELKQLADDDATGCLWVFCIVIGISIFWYIFK